MYTRRKVDWMKHYLTKIEIKKLRHLTNLCIELDEGKKQHLLLTGKNGSGKTTLLIAMQKYLKAINDRKLKMLKEDYVLWLGNAERALNAALNENEKYEKEKNYKEKLRLITQYSDGLDLQFNEYRDLDYAYEKGNFIIAYFPAERKTKIVRPQGVQDIKLKDFYGIDEDPGSVLVKYMVHLKTQQAYARNELDMANVSRIEEWFERFQDALRYLFDDDELELEYNYKDYDFRIIESGREPFAFDQLSDGYSAVIHIISDLILRMDKNWMLNNELSEYDIEGIVLIDELETHLHIELQKKILPFLTKFFPNIQFIVTTHSPYILNSISNAKAYDLEKRIELENLYRYSSEDLAEAYFDTDEYAHELIAKLYRYQELVNLDEITEEERAERANLRIELKNISSEMFGEVKDKFEEIEMQRKTNG